MAAGQGREAQRRRTRSAIIEATSSLVAAGGSPSADEIATAADVSRRTVYMHFPTLDQLLLDATVGALSQAIVDAALDEAGGGGDPIAALEALVTTLVRTAPTTLPLGRRIIALTVDAPTRDDGPRRGYRRIGWIEQAIAPLRDQLTAKRYERLLSALAVIVGWEAMIVLRDVRGLAPRQEAEVLRWAARSLVEAALAE